MTRFAHRLARRPIIILARAIAIIYIGYMIAEHIAHHRRTAQ